MKTLEEIENDKNLEFEKQLEQILSKRKSATPNKTACEAYGEAVRGINIKENEALVLADNNPYISYIFAKDVKGADIDKHIEKLKLEYGENWNSSIRNLQFKKADILIGKLEDDILNKKRDNSNYLYYEFAKANITRDLTKITKAILDSDKCKYVYSFARDIPGVDYEAFIKKLESKPKFIDKANKLRKLAYKRTGNKMFLTNGRVPKNPSKSALDAYKEALMGINVKENQQIVIDDNSDYLIYSFAKDVKGADIKLLQSAIIENEDFHFVIRFFNDVKGCDVSKLEDSLIKSKNNDAIYTFACNIPKANIKRLGQAIIESENLYDNYVFAKDVFGADIKAHIEVLKKHNCLDKIKELEDKLNSQKPKKTNQEATEEAKQGINVKENEQIILAFNNAEYSCLFASDVKGADIKAHEKIVLQEKDPYNCYRFALNVPGANIKDLENVILQLKIPYWSFHFAKDIPNANIQSHIELLEKHPEYYSRIIEFENILLSRNKTNSNVSWLKQNAQEGMYQGIAASAINNLAISLIKLLESLNVDEVSIKIFKDFIETDLGKASLSALIGAGIHFAPNDVIKNNIHIQKVADKCIQNASSKGIEHGANLAMNFILPALLSSVNTPQAKNLELLSSKLRVNTIDNQIEDEIFEPANEVGSIRK